MSDGIGCSHDVNAAETAWHRCVGAAAGRTGSSVSGATLKVVDDFIGRRTEEVLVVLVSADDPAIGAADFPGGNSSRMAGFAAEGCPTGGASIRETANDCGGTGDSVEVTAINPASACGSASLLGSAIRLDAPRRTSERAGSLPLETMGDGGEANESTRAFGFGSDARLAVAGGTLVRSAAGGMKSCLTVIVGAATCGFSPATATATETSDNSSAGRVVGRVISLDSKRRARTASRV
ncbi:MAG: hypothetical protein FD138_1501 [Planctomycetota bacterium]|nr:MAG: hypothetical protein FD138_1501 [Planctomycetota bacterium]